MSVDEAGTPLPRSLPPLRSRRGREEPARGLDLLTLSACETAVVEDQRGTGREVDGLAMLAQTKGANAPESWGHPFYWAPFILLGNWL